MPYTQYSGNQSVDHVLFRRFLRSFDPDVIYQWAVDYIINHINELDLSILKQYQLIHDENLQTKAKDVVPAINEVNKQMLDLGDLVLSNETRISILEQRTFQSNKEVVEVANLTDLYKITSPQEEVLYVLQDTNDIYMYDGDEFFKITNQWVGNSIYVNDLDVLINYPFTKEGTYIVVYTHGTKMNIKADVYILYVQKRKSAIGGTKYIPILSNINGWAEVIDENGDLSWEWHMYSYNGHTHIIGDVTGLRNELDEIKTLAYAGL